MTVLNNLVISTFFRLFFLDQSGDPTRYAGGLGAGAGSASDADPAACIECACSAAGGGGGHGGFGGDGNSSAQPLDFYADGSAAIGGFGGSVYGSGASAAAEGALG